MKILNFVSRNYIKLSILFYFIGMSQAVAIAYRDKSLANFFPWKLTQFYVDYFDFGFVKRGFIGTLLYPVFSLIGGDPLYSKVAILVFDFAIFLCLLFFLRRAIEKLLPAQCDLALVLKTIMILSPLGAMQFAYDTGRYDHVNFLLAAYALVLLVRHKTLLAGTIVAIGVLVHEAVFVFGFPVLLAASIAINNEDPDDKRKFANSLVFASLPVLAAALVTVYGNANVDLTSVLAPGMAQGSGVWSRGILLPKQLQLGALQYPVVAFYSVFPYVLLRHFYLANNLKFDLLFLATLGSIFLFILGTDYPRWCQLILASTVIALFFHILQGKTRFAIGNREAFKVGLSVYLLPLGPIGVIFVLPYVETLWRVLTR